MVAKKSPLNKVWNTEFLHSQQPFLLAGCGRGKLLICSSQGPPEEQCAGKNQNRAAEPFQKAASSRWRQQFICWEEGHEGYVLLMQLKLLNKTHCSSNISQAGQEKKAGCHCIIPGTSGVSCFPELGLYQDSIFSLGLVSVHARRLVGLLKIQALLGKTLPLLRLLIPIWWHCTTLHSLVLLLCSFPYLLSPTFPSEGNEERIEWICHCSSHGWQKSS